MEARSLLLLKYATATDIVSSSTAKLKF